MLLFSWTSSFCFKHGRYHTSAALDVISVEGVVRGCRSNYEGQATRDRNANISRRGDVGCLCCACKSTAEEFRDMWLTPPVAQTSFATQLLDLAIPRWRAVARGSRLARFHISGQTVLPYEIRGKK